MMTVEKLAAAIREANRFIEKAKVAQKEQANREHYFLGSKETGAARRASMDLTRALADLRRS